MTQITRKPLPQDDPVLVNDLLDLFDAYVATIGAPLMTATNLIRDELGYREGDIFEHVVGVVDDASLMAQRLKRIRAARNAGTDVVVTLTEAEERRAEVATAEVEYLLSQAASIFEHLHTGIASGHVDPEGRGCLAVLDLSRRAFEAAAAEEGRAVSELSDLIRRASARRIGPQGEKSR